MKLLLYFIISCNCSLAFTRELTIQYTNIYLQENVLDRTDLEQLKDLEIVLIPGIASETFDSTDDRSVLDLSFYFENYLVAQETYFESLGLQVTRLRSSSFSKSEALIEIHEQILELKNSGKKAVFMTHSMGGLILLEYLVKTNPESIVNVSGIIFMQSPFDGSPIASVYFQNPYLTRSLLGPIMRFVHTSEDSINYLTIESRQKWMSKYSTGIKALIKKVPIITTGGLSQNYPSLMAPSVNIIAHGCINVWKNKCLSNKLYAGPYDNSDGMVPFESSKLANSDYVKLMGVDHGETVLAMPFKNIDRVKMSAALLKMILLKINH